MVGRDARKTEKEVPPCYPPMDQQLTTRSPSGRIVPIPRSTAQVPEQVQALDLRINANSNNPRNTVPVPLQLVQTANPRCTVQASNAASKLCEICKREIPQVSNSSNSSNSIAFCSDACFEIYRRGLFKRRNFCSCCGNKGDWGIAEELSFHVHLEDVVNRVCSSCEAQQTRPTIMGGRGRRNKDQTAPLPPLPPLPHFPSPQQNYQAHIHEPNYSAQSPAITSSRQGYFTQLPHSPGPFPPLHNLRRATSPIQSGPSDGRHRPFQPWFHPMTPPGQELHQVYHRNNLLPFPATYPDYDNLSSLPALSHQSGLHQHEFFPPNVEIIPPRVLQPFNALHEPQFMTRHNALRTPQICPLQFLPQHPPCMNSAQHNSFSQTPTLQRFPYPILGNPTVQNQHFSRGKLVDNMNPQMGTIQAEYPLANLNSIPTRQLASRQQGQSSRLVIPDSETVKMEPRIPMSCRQQLNSQNNRINPVLNKYQKKIVENLAREMTPAETRNKLRLAEINLHRQEMERNDPRGFGLVQPSHRKPPTDHHPPPRPPQPPPPPPCIFSPVAGFDIQLCNDRCLVLKGLPESQRYTQLEQFQIETLLGPTVLSYIGLRASPVHGCTATQATSYSQTSPVEACTPPWARQREANLPLPSTTSVNSQPTLFEGALSLPPTVANELPTMSNSAFSIVVPSQLSSILGIPENSSSVSYSSPAPVIVDITESPPPSSPALVIVNISDSSPPSPASSVPEIIAEYCVPVLINVHVPESIYSSPLPPTSTTVAQQIQSTLPTPQSNEIKIENPSENAVLPETREDQENYPFELERLLRMDTAKGVLDRLEREFQCRRTRPGSSPPANPNMHSNRIFNSLNLSPQDNQSLSPRALNNALSCAPHPAYSHGNSPSSQTPGISPSSGSLQNQLQDQQGIPMSALNQLQHNLQTMRPIPTNLSEISYSTPLKIEIPESNYNSSSTRSVFSKRFRTEERPNTPFSSSFSSPQTFSQPPVPPLPPQEWQDPTTPALPWASASRYFGLGLSPREFWRFPKDNNNLSSEHLKALLEKRRLDSGPDTLQGLLSPPVPVSSPVPKRLGRPPGSGRGKKRGAALSPAANCQDPSLPKNRMDGADRGLHWFNSGTSQDTKTSGSQTQDSPIRRQWGGGGVGRGRYVPIRKGNGSECSSSTDLWSPTSSTESRDIITGSEHFRFRPRFERDNEMEDKLLEQSVEQKKGSNLAPIFVPVPNRLYTKSPLADPSTSFQLPTSSTLGEGQLDDADGKKRGLGEGSGERREMTQVEVLIEKHVKTITVGEDEDDERRLVIVEDPIEVNAMRLRLNLVSNGLPVLNASDIEQAISLHEVEHEEIVVSDNTVDSSGTEEGRGIYASKNTNVKQEQEQTDENGN